MPLINSNNKWLSLVGYGLYGMVGLFVFLIVLGLIVGPAEKSKPIDTDISSNDVVSAGAVTEKMVDSILKSHNGGHDYKVSVNDMGVGEGYNVAITLLPEDEWSSEWLVEDSANTFVEILKELYKNPNVGRVYIAQQGKFTDQYGNEKIEKAVVVDMRRDTANKINWDKFGDLVLLDYNKLFNVADSYSIHPAIKKDLT